MPSQESLHSSESSESGSQGSPEGSKVAVPKEIMVKGKACPRATSGSQGSPSEGLKEALPEEIMVKEKTSPRTPSGRQSSSSESSEAESQGSPSEGLKEALPKEIVRKRTRPCTPSGSQGSSCEGFKEKVRESKRARTTEKRSKNKHDLQTTSKKGKEKVKAKANPFERSWAEEDEIELLSGLKRCKDENNVGTHKISEFFNAAKDCLSVELRRKFTEKSIRSKMLRFQNNFLARESKGTAKPLHFENKHRMLLYNLSNEVWETKTTGIKATEEQYRLMVEYFSKELPFSISSEMIDLLLKSKANELYGRWKEMLVKELKIQIEKAALMKEVLSAWLEEQGEGNKGSSALAGEGKDIST